MTIFRNELKRELEELQKQELPPYHLNYRVIDKQSDYINTSFGSVTNSESNHLRSLVPQVRIGNSGFDNFKENQMGAAPDRNGQLPLALLPLEDEGGEQAVRQAVWNETNKRYQFAVSVYQNSLAMQSINVENDDKAPCFSAAPVEKYNEEPLPLNRCKLDKSY